MRTTLIHCDRCSKNLTESSYAPTLLQVGYANTDPGKPLRPSHQFEICDACAVDFGEFMKLAR